MCWTRSSNGVPGAHGRLVPPMGQLGGGRLVGLVAGVGSQRLGGAGVEARACRSASYPAPWQPPGLVETRFSPDALVWVAVVFHGTAAWRNHGLIIFRFCFIEHLSSCAVQLSRLVAGSAPQAPHRGLGHLLVGYPLCAAGSPGGARVTRSVIACDAGGALDLGGGSVDPSRGRRGDARPPPHPS